MTIADWLMIVVVLLAPLIAVQVQKWLESWNEKSERKRKIFETLMTTRATRLDPAHVAALNMIDFVFDKDKSINEKWREYLDCLCEVPQTPSIQATENEIRYAQQSMEKWEAASRHNLYLVERCLRLRTGLPAAAVATMAARLSVT